MKRAIILMIPIIGLMLITEVSIAQPFGIHKGKNKNNYKILSSNGRYIFGQISNSDKDQYMLDTWTGRLWRISENGEVGKFLMPVPYQLKNGKYSFIPEPIKKK